MIYFDISEIKRANRKAGFHFFDADTLRFFNSKVLPTVYAGNHFITSERFESDPRRYTIRRAHPDGSIDTIGEFCAYASLTEAKRALKHAVRLAEVG